MSGFHHIISVGFVAALAAGCAINPVSGRPEFVLVSANQEKKIGQTQAQQIEREMVFGDAPALSAYVDAIGQRLAEGSPRRDITSAFRIIDMPEPNAFALPGGHVYVTRGLLVLVNSEDELAGVIGHEIGHVAARHSVQQVSRAAPFGIVTGLTAAATGIVSPLLGRVVGGVGALASGLVLAPFNREQEREADRVGQQLAAQAGWDPSAIARFLTTLERDDGLRRKGPQHQGFLDSHPSTPERIANTVAFAADLQRAPREPLSANRAEFLARLDGIVVGARAADGVFDGRHFLHPTLNFAISFPEQWHTQNGRQQVAAAAPDGDALVLITTVASGDDPLDGARAFEKASGATVLSKTQPSTINGLRAARARTQGRTEQGDLSVELTWIAHAGRIYEIVGVTPPQRRERFASVFDQVAQSFRPLQPGDRARIREERLRIVEARSGEGFDALVQRAKASWSVDTVAVANGLAAGDPLVPGQLIKVAVTEVYSTTTAR